MAQPSVQASGTVVTDGNEQDLVEIVDTPGYFMLVVDASALDTTDEVTLRLYDQVDGVNPRVRRKLESAAGAQDPAMLELGPIEVFDYFKATLEQTVGTAESLPWHVRRL